MRLVFDVGIIRFLKKPRIEIDIKNEIIKTIDDVDDLVTEGQPVPRRGIPRPDMTQGNEAFARLDNDLRVSITFAFWGRSANSVKRRRLFPLLRMELLFNEYFLLRAVYITEHSTIASSHCYDRRQLMRDTVDQAITFFKFFNYGLVREHCSRTLSRCRGSSVREAGGFATGVHLES
jgi:hypothetical protein